MAMGKGEKGRGTPFRPAAVGSCFRRNDEIRGAGVTREVNQGGREKKGRRGEGHPIPPRHRGFLLSQE